MSQTMRWSAADGENDDRDWPTLDELRKEFAGYVIDEHEELAAWTAIRRPDPQHEHVLAARSLMELRGKLRAAVADEASGA